MHFRLRIAHQLAWLLASAVAASVLAVSALIAWNLTGGFSDYVRERETERLDRFALFVGERAFAAGSLEAVLAAPDGMRALVNGFLLREGLQAPAPAAQATPELPDASPPDSGHNDFPRRVQITNPAGERMAGLRSSTDPSLQLVRPIMRGTQNIGSVRLMLPARPSGIDAEFLRRQYNGVLLVAGGIVAVFLLLAVAVARRWSQPLLQLSGITRQLALGHFDAKLPPHRGAREIAHLFDDVAAMAAALQRLEAARRHWVAQISHELRSPLSVLRGEIESVEDGAREPSRALITSLAEEVAQLHRIVEDMHVLAMADLGALPCNRVLLDPNAVLRGIVSRQLRQPALAGLVVTVVEPVHTAVQAEWDAGRVEQVVANLLQNSARYTNRPGQVRVSWGHAPGSAQLVVEVEDSAPGVVPQDLEQIFEPLFRGDGARQRDRASGGPGGSGLGLSIARAIVTMLGGSIQARASALGGLAVRFHLPTGPSR